MIAMGQVQQPVFGHETCDIVSRVASEMLGSLAELAWSLSGLGL